MTSYEMVVHPVWTTEQRDKIIKALERRFKRNKKKTIEIVFAELDRQHQLHIKMKLNNFGEKDDRFKPMEAAVKGVLPEEDLLISFIDINT